VKTHFKYIYFIKIEDKIKTSVWHCLSQSNHAVLGVVKWYGPWRQYCFMPEPNTVFNISCNNDINEFIQGLMDERKSGKGGKE